MLVDGRPGRHGVDLDLYIMTHPDVALRGNANYERTDIALQDGASVMQLLCRAEKYIGSVLT